MRILFLMKSPGSARNFESALRVLGQRGHEIHLAFDGRGAPGSRAAVENLYREFPRVSLGKAPSDPRDSWSSLGKALRLGIDYLRYLHPRYDDSPALRARARAGAPAPVPQLAALPLVRGPRGLALLDRFLRAFERLAPPPQVVDDYLRSQRPDVVLVTPLVWFGSAQAAYIRSAKQLGIPVMFCVHSWDNLTNKGVLHDIPDRVAVWNEAQRREAVELHGVAEESVVVTGAHSYDQWFDRQPGRTRKAFCAEVGLDPERPFFLYVCSSPFIARNEVGAVRRWLAALRDSGRPELADAGILIRPHPQNARQWREEQFGDEQVAIWPRLGADPLTDRERSNYFESIHYSAGVVGVNTSALVEAAIIGRRVHTVVEDFEDTQTGTLHFRMLVDSDSGLLRVARGLDDHVAQLGEALDAGSDDLGQNRAFLESFVRPYGLDEPAAPRLADAVKELEGCGAEPQTAPSPLTRLLRRVFAPLGTLAASRRRRARRRARKDLDVPDREPIAGVDPKPKSQDPILVARALVHDIAESDRPLLAGPFLGEVGYELLYWIPFLAWAFEVSPELAGRTTVVSRGGSAPWYKALGVEYLDVYDYLEPDQLRELAEQAARESSPKSERTAAISDGEHHLLEAMAAREGLEQPLYLHPSTMFQLYWQLLKSGVLFRPKSTFVHHPLPTPPLGPLEGQLPNEFVAARFYFNASFPETAENMAFVKSTLERLAESVDVVLLNPPERFDDHWDFEVDASHRVIRLDSLMTPRNNLEVQTIAVSRARAFVGTYGGLSYLPPLLRVPTLAFYSDASRFRQHHLEIAARASQQPGFGPFVTLDTANAGLAALALGGAPELLEGMIGPDGESSVVA